MRLLLLSLLVFCAQLLIKTEGKSATLPPETTMMSFSDDSIPDDGFVLEANLRIYLRKIFIKNATFSEVSGQEGHLNLLTAGDDEFGNSRLTLSAEGDRRVRAVAKLNVSSLFDYENGHEIKLADKITLDEFIDNVFIEVENTNDDPVAIIRGITMTVGKRDILLGLHDIDDVIPMAYTYWSNFQQRKGVLGLTIAFDMGETIDFADQISLTFYEAEGGDFDFNRDAMGFLARMEKKIGDNTTLVMSYSERENEYLRNARGDRLNYDYGDESLA